MLFDQPQLDWSHTAASQLLLGGGLVGDGSSDLPPPPQADSASAQASALKAKRHSRLLRCMFVSPNWIVWIVIGICRSKSTRI